MGLDGRERKMRRLSTCARTTGTDTLADNNAFYKGAFALHCLFVLNCLLALQCKKMQRTTDAVANIHSSFLAILWKDLHTTSTLAHYIVAGFDCIAMQCIAFSPPALHLRSTGSGSLQSIATYCIVSICIALLCPLAHHWHTRMQWTEYFCNAF